MGHLLTIEGDEAVALATELATLRGESLDASILAVLRQSVERERKRQAWIAETTAILDDFRGSLPDPPPSSNHDFLYDDRTGLPR